MYPGGDPLKRATGPCVRVQTKPDHALNRHFPATGFQDLSWTVFAYRPALEALGRAQVRFLSDPLRGLSLLANDVVGVLLVDDLFDLCCLVPGHHDE
jgi:hypothetical protein